MVAADRVVMGHQDMAAKTLERSSLYGFLALVFREEPTAAFLRKMRSAQLLDALSSAGVRFDEEFFARPDEELLDDLAVEYTRLFIGPGRHVPPSEGAQREGALWGKATSRVASFVENCGFGYLPQFSDLPDHISVELEFMQEITKREAKAWEQEDRAAARHWLRIERKFIGEHLARWAPLFCEKVAQEAECYFYIEMAVLTDIFIQREHRELRKRLENGEDEPV